jgi:hypothetical protein
MRCFIATVLKTVIPAKAGTHAEHRPEISSNNATQYGFAFFISRRFMLEVDFVKRCLTLGMGPDFRRDDGF